jgi:hypothetical protein
MRETARRLEPDVTRLAAGGVSRGTRLRRLEWTVHALGSVAAVVVVFAGVVLFGQPRGVRAGGGGGELNQPTESTAISPSLTTPSVTNPTVPDPTLTTMTPTGAPQISEDELISTLKSGLGETDVTGRSYVARGSESAAASDSETDSTAEMTSPIMVDAQLSVRTDVGFLSIVFSGPEDDVAQPGTPRRLPDRSVVYITNGSASSDGSHPDRITLQVTVIRPDGSGLYAIETNSLTEKSAAAPGAPLLLSPDQLITLLDSSAWDSAIAAADARPSAMSWNGSSPSTGSS